MPAEAFHKRKSANSTVPSPVRSPCERNMFVLKKFDLIMLKSAIVQPLRPSTSQSNRPLLKMNCVALRATFEMRTSSIRPTNPSLEAVAPTTRASVPIVIVIGALTSTPSADGPPIKLAEVKLGSTLVQ